MPGTPFVITAGLDLMGSLNIVMADLGTVQNPTLKLLVGQLDNAQAMTFLPGSLAVGKMAASVAEVPMGGMSGLGDDILYLAGPTGLSRKELSLLFVDVWGNTRVEQKLTDTLGEVTNAAIVPRGVNTALGRYHIAWSEEYQDAMGNKYDKIFYDQLECL
jgi:hypothetical protein